MNDVLSETMKPRKEREGIFELQRIFEKKKSQTRILYPGRILCKYEGGTKVRWKEPLPADLCYTKCKQVLQAVENGIRCHLDVHQRTTSAENSKLWQTHTTEYYSATRITDYWCTQCCKWISRKDLLHDTYSSCLIPFISRSRTGKTNLGWKISQQYFFQEA